MKKYLIIFRQAPFANSVNLEGLELALTLAAFEQNVSLLLLGAGVLQLVPNKESGLIVQKDYTKALAGLDLFGIQGLYAEQSAISKYNLDLSNLLSIPTVVNAQQINTLFQSFDVVLNI